MTAIEVVTKYEELNRILYEHGKSNRKNYDVSYHEGEYERKTSEMIRMQSEATKEFLVKNQDIILISIRDLIKVAIEYCAQVEYKLHGTITIFSGDYEQLDEEVCNRYLVQMIASLMESVCSIEKFSICYSSIGFCPMKKSSIMDLTLVANFPN